MEMLLIFLVMFLIVFVCFYFYISSYYLGYCITLFVNIFMKKTFKEFKLKAISFYPFILTDLNFTIRATRKSPEASLSWKSLRLLLDIYKLLDPMLDFLQVFPVDGHKDTLKMLTIVFEDFHASSFELFYELFLDPDNKPPLPKKRNENGHVLLDQSSPVTSISYKIAMARFLQHLMHFVDIQFHQVGFHFEFPVHESKVVGNAEKMIISFPKGSTKSYDSAAVMIHFTEGRLEVTQCNQRAVYLVSHQARMHVDVHMPSKIQEIVVSLFGTEEQLHIDIVPFLTWFTRYQRAEDNSSEKKMALGIRVNGNMYLRGECEYINVFFTDYRCKNVMRMSMEQVQCELRSYFLTFGDGYRTYKDKLVHNFPEKEIFYAATGLDLRTSVKVQQILSAFKRNKTEDEVPMTPNRDKVMTAYIKNMEFHTQSTNGKALIEEIYGLKVQREFNEGNFIDNDRQDGYARSMRFENVSSELLDWLIVLKDTADKMPSSRFAHDKHSDMFFRFELFIFSTQPVIPSYKYCPTSRGNNDKKEDSQKCDDDADDDEDENNNSVDDEPHTMNEINFIPLSDLTDIPIDINKVASFEFHDFALQKLLNYGEFNSVFDFKSKMFKTQSVLCTKDLKDYCNVSTGESVDNCVENQNINNRLLSGNELLTGISIECPCFSFKFKNTQKGSEFEFFKMDSFKFELMNGKDISALQSSLFLLIQHINIHWDDGRHMLANINDIEMQGFSTVGAVKAKSGIDLVRSMVDRVSSRIAYISKISIYNILPVSITPPTYEKLEPSRNVPLMTVKFHNISVVIPINISHEYEVNYDQMYSDYKRKQKAKNELTREDTLFDLNIPDESELLRSPSASSPAVLDRNSSTNNNKIDLESTSAAWIPIDRSYKSICVSLSSLEFTSTFNDIDTHVKLEMCCVSLKNFPEYPWMIIKGISFTKRMLPLEMKDFFYEDTDIDIPEEASMVTKSMFDVEIESFEVRLSVRMEIGAIIDQLSSQMSALSVAVSTSSTEKPYDTFNPFEVHFLVNSFSVLLDSHYQDSYIDSFMCFKCKNIDFSLDATKHPISIQDQITTLDLNNDPLPNNQQLFIYTGVVGGNLNFFMKSISLRFKPLTDSFLELEEISFIGPVYSASITDPRITVEVNEILLYESQPIIPPILNGTSNTTSTTKNVKKSTYLKLFSIVEEDLIYVITTKSTAPGKIYLDILIAARIFEFIAHPMTMQCIEAVSSTVSCLSINTDTTPVLATWDNVRYWMHGKFNFSTDQILINVYAQDYMTQNMKLRFALDLFKFYIDCNSISMTAENIIFDAEITSKLIGNTNRRTSSSRKTLSKTNSINTKLFSIPSLVFSLKHSLTSFTEEKPSSPHKNVSAFYSHHDVYLRPAIDDSYYFLEEYEKPERDIIKYQNNDKFINFRSKKFTYKWKIEFRIADEKDIPIHFNIRIDHVVCIIDAINFMYVTNSSHTKISSETVSDQVAYDDLSYYNKNKPKLEILPLSAVDMVSVVEVQAEFDKVMVSSWPSGANLGGFVLEVGSSDLQLRMKRDLINLNIYGSDENSDAPLQVDHFFVETSIVELYVRQWIIPSTSQEDAIKSKLQENPFNRMEPKRNPDFDKIPNTWFEITKLFQPIYKVAHTTKMTISLTESGEVCIRDPNFVKSGILVKVKEKKHDIIYKNLGINPLYISIRISRKHSKFLSESSNPVFHIGKDWKDQNNETSLEKCKRKSLFHILKVDAYNKGHILFENSTSPEHISPLHSRQRRISMVSRRRTVSLVKDLPPLKFTGYRASLQVFKVNHSAFAPPSHILPPSYSVIKSGFLKSAYQHKQLRSNPDDLQDSSYGNKIWGLRIIDLRLLFTIDIRDVIFGYVARCMDLIMAGTNNDLDDTKYSSTIDATAEDGKRRFSYINLKKKPEARASFSDFKNSDRFFNATDYSDAETNIKNEAMNTNNDDNNINLTSSEIINHLLSKSVSDEILQNDKIVVDGKDNIIKNDSNAKTFTINQRLQSNIISKTNTKSVGICFFVVEFLDPQVNFLDVKTHSSLIIVAGLSSLEGRRFSHATLPPKNVLNARNKIRNSMDNHLSSTAAMLGLEPKRQQEVRLRMDGVSAFTVPTIAPSDDATTTTTEGNNIDESSVVDIVHWKHMTTTSFTKVPSKKHASLFSRSKGSEDTESPYMHMAIKDFQIRALYIFWTDVTVSEAKLMHIEHSKQDLVCSFKLELPVIIVDILSWQFYVIMHVVRNVLLVPPPASAKRANHDSEMELDKKQLLEIPRNPDIVAAQKSTTLDLNLKNCRDEVKNLIEQNLSDVMLEMEYGSARLVECFIGSCTWVLRTNISSSDIVDDISSEVEQLKVSFTGIHATFFYGEDRCSTSSFEVQRFWVKDMYPDRDSSRNIIDQNNLNTKKSKTKQSSIVLMPILNQTEHCSRCSAAFLLEENHPNACVFHANIDGEPGVYKEITILDELTRLPRVIKAWSCCMKHHIFAQGCSARPHSCKELMIQIRAEANPKTRIENIDVSVLKTVEISIFPNSSYDLKVQVTKSLTDLLHKYFYIDKPEQLEIVPKHLLSPIKRNRNWKKIKQVFQVKIKKNNEMIDDDGNIITNAITSDNNELNALLISSNSMNQDCLSPVSIAEDDCFSPMIKGSETNLNRVNSINTPCTPVSRPPLSPATTSSEYSDNNHKKDQFQTNAVNVQPNKWLPLSAIRLPFSVTSPTSLYRRSVTDHKDTMNKHDSHSNTINAKHGSAGTRFNLRARSVSAPEINTNNNNMDRLYKSAAKQEAVYVKFFRLGEIKFEVHTTGFLINLSSFKAEMNEFICQGECMLWSQLIWKMEQHIAINLIRNAASSGFTRITDIISNSASTVVATARISDTNTLHDKVRNSQQYKRATYLKWEDVDDPKVADNLKRSALGLPPKSK